MAGGHDPDRAEPGLGAAGERTVPGLEAASFGIFLYVFGPGGGQHPFPAGQLGGQRGQGPLGQVRVDNLVTTWLNVLMVACDAALSTRCWRPAEFRGSACRADPAAEHAYRSITRTVEYVGRAPLREAVADAQPLLGTPAGMRGRPASLRILMKLSSSPVAPFRHLQRLTHTIGVVASADGIMPRHGDGYRVDDAARGLVVVCREPSPSAE